MYRSLSSCIKRILPSSWSSIFQYACNTLWQLVSSARGLNLNVFSTPPSPSLPKTCTYRKASAGWMLKQFSSEFYRLILHSTFKNIQVCSTWKEGITSLSIWPSSCYPIFKIPNLSSIQQPCLTAFAKASHNRQYPLPLNSPSPFIDLLSHQAAAPKEQWPCITYFWYCKIAGIQHKKTPWSVFRYRPNQKSTKFLKMIPSTCILRDLSLSTRDVDGKP